MSKAFFAGSFNPFTIGHASIVERAIPIFDQIVIGIGYNAEKGDSGDIKDRLKAIQKFAERFPDGKIQVMAYSNALTIDMARQYGCDYLLRGVRSVKDFEYERDMADINREIGGIETLIMFSLPQYAAVSSSIVRELASHGVDVSGYLP